MVLGIHGQLLLQGWMWLGLQVASPLALLALRAIGMVNVY